MGWSTIRGEAVEFRSCGQTIQAHLGRPAVPGRFPAVIILHGLPGLQPNVKRAAERFGDEGYVGLAINWQSAEPDPPDADQMSYVADAAAYLRGLDCVDGDRIAVAGYCRGGALVILALGTHPWLRAGVSFHGDAFYRQLDAKKPQHPYDLADQFQAPLLILHGGNDRTCEVADMYRLAQRLEELGKPYALKVYGSVGHAFALPEMKAYDPRAGADAWPEAIRFLDQHLKGWR